MCGLRPLWMVTLIATMSTAACGGGLAHTVPESSLSALSGEQRETVAAQRAKVQELQKALSQNKKDHKTSEANVDKVEDRVDKAEVTVEKTEVALDKTEDTLDKAVEAAENRRDKAIEAAEKRYEKEIADAKARFKSDKAKYSAALKTAEATQSVEEARQVYEERLLAEREQRNETLEAELWAARALYEKIKFEQLAKAKETTGPAHKARMLEFEQQWKEREAEARDKRADLKDLERETSIAKRELDAAKKRAGQTEK